MILLGAATIYLFPEPLPSSSVTPRSDAVPRSENLHVMPFVAGNHVRDRPYAHRLAARGAAPSPCIAIECAQQGEGRRPGGAQLADEIGERAGVEPCNRDIRVLIESRQRRGIAARDPQRPVGHDALDVGEVADDFLDAPFTVRVAMYRVRF